MTQFYINFETGTSDRTFKGLDQILKSSGFSLYTLSFFLYSPFKNKNRKKNGHFPIEKHQIHIDKMPALVYKIQLISGFLERNHQRKK